MYYADRRSHKHAKIRKRLIIVLILIIVSAVIYVLANLRLAPQQQLKNSPSLSRKGNVTPQKQLNIQKTEFTMLLPDSWKETPPINTPVTPNYSFADTTNARSMNVYINHPPHYEIGLNRALVVTSTNGKIAHDVVSDNCTTFTEASKKNPSSGLAPAKWQEVDFLCDIGNGSRALVGTISKDGINHFLVQLPNGVSYKVFISYSDNNINPDYSVFYDILQSMQFR